MKSLNAKFGQVRSLVYRIGRERQSKDDLVSILSSIRSDNIDFYTNVIVPYLSSFDVFEQVPLKTVNSLDELDDNFLSMTFANIELDVCYWWRDEQWFLNQFKSDYFKKVISCDFRGNEFDNDLLSELLSIKQLNVKKMNLNHTFITRDSIELINHKEIIFQADFSFVDNKPKHIYLIPSPLGSEFVEDGIQGDDVSEDDKNRIKCLLPALKTEIENDINDYVSRSAFRCLDEFPSLYILSGTFYIESIWLEPQMRLFIMCYVNENRRGVEKPYLGVELCWNIAKGNGALDILKENPSQSSV